MAFVPGGYSQELSDAYDKEPVPWVMEQVWMLVILLPFGAAVFAGFLGLYFFKHWGRSLSLYSTLAGLFIIPFFGATISSGIESSFYEASTLLWGAILALAYYSPLSHKFDVKPLVPTIAESVPAESAS